MAILAAVVFIITGVLLNVNQHKGWGWTLIVLGALVGVAIIL